MVVNWVDYGLGGVLEQRGLTLSTDHDFDSLWEFIETAPAWPETKNPAFNPAWNVLDPTASLWLKLSRGDAVVGTLAIKHLDLGTDTYNAAMMDGRFLYSRGVGQHPDEWLEVNTRLGRVLRGRVSFAGCLWLHPDVRGQGLATAMLHAGRVAGRDLWDIEWDIGWASDGLVHNGTVTQAYWYEAAERGLRWSRPDWFAGITTDWVLATSRWLIDQQVAAVRRSPEWLSRWAPPSSPAAGPGRRPTPTAGR